MSFEMDIARDLDEILASWLNMNLAKSQQGSYVPIAITHSFDHNKLSTESFDFFVVTSKNRIKMI